MATEAGSPLARRAEAIGIDPADPKYDTEYGGYTGGPLCPWCLRHQADHPRLRCDVLVAENPGGHGCSLCLELADDPDMNRRCRRCADRERAEAAAARRGRRRFTTGDRKIYVPDGHGCVERLHPTEAALDRLEREGPDRGW